MNLDLQKVLPAEAFETEQNEGDYIGKDGLLYCGVCRTKKQTRLPASDFTGGREIIVPCICKCKVEEKAIDGYTFPNDTTCRYECTLAESELAGKEISEIGLYDTNGDIVCIKTFTRKGKDDDVEQTYVLDDIF